MENILTMENLSALPQNLFADVRSAAKTALLTRQIRKELADGMEPEEILAQRLPATAPEEVQEAAEALSDGVEKFYDNLNDEVDDTWIESHLNQGLSELKTEDRAGYLLNLLDITPADALDEDAKNRVEELRSAESFTDEDISFLLESARSALSGNAGLLTRTSVQVMNDVMGILPGDTVKEMASAGPDTALAYGMACHILLAQGENPWGLDEDFTADSYSLGMICAANTESSKLMSLYYTGKIEMAALKEKLHRLFKAVITYVCGHAVRFAAMGIQVALGVSLYNPILRILYGSLCLGPWVSLIGAGVLSILISTRFVTTQDYVNILNGLWNGVRAGWKWCMSRWTGVPQEDEADDAAVSDDADAASDVSDDTVLSDNDDGEAVSDPSDVNDESEILN